MKFLLSCLLFFTSINAAEPFAIFFNKASSQEVSEIQEHLITFYSQQLFDAGLFDDLIKAAHAATSEWNQDKAENPSKELYYYHLVSKDSPTRYGYLVYSIVDRTAYLEALYLEKTYRAQGVGKQIMRDFENELRQKGVQEIRLYVFAQNVAAFTLYNKMGYLVETTYQHDGKLIGHHLKKFLQNE